MIASQLLLSLSLRQVIRSSRIPSRVAYDQQAILTNYPTPVPTPVAWDEDHPRGYYTGAEWESRELQASGFNETHKLSSALSESYSRLDVAFSNSSFHRACCERLFGINR
jgi:hypothetical protein